MISVLPWLLFGIISWVIDDFIPPCDIDYCKYLNKMKVTEDPIRMLQ